MLKELTGKNSAARIGSSSWCCWIVLLSLVFLASCSVGRYNPSASIAAGAGKNPVAYPGSVSIVNAQESTVDHKLNLLRTVVNYHDFTQSVVDALKRELQTSGTSISDGSGKRLSVKVTNVTFDTGGWGNRAVIKAEVQMGDGDIIPFTASRASAASGLNMTIAPTKPLDSAFKDLVSSILNSVSVQTYLSTK